MKNMKVLAVLIVILFIAAPAQAQEKKWVDEAELSFVDTGGNTDITSLLAKNLLKYTFSEKLQGAWKLGALYAKSDGVKRAESYFTELRADYLYTESLYFLGIAGWLKDEFAGIDSRYYLGPGVGCKYFTGPKHFLIAEAGLNYAQEEYTNSIDENFIQGRLFAQYDYAFTKKDKFFQSLEFLYDFEDSDNYNINSETALISALSDYLSLKASYVIRHDNEPAPKTLDETDTVLAITLVVNF